MEHGVGDGDEEGVSLGEQWAELAGPGVDIAAGDRHAQPAAAVVVPAERDTAALHRHHLSETLEIIRGHSQSSK